MAGAADVRGGDDEAPVEEIPVATAPPLTSSFSTLFI